MLEWVLSFILLGCSDFLVSDFQRIDSVHTFFLNSMKSGQVTFMPESVIIVKLVIHQSVQGWVQGHALVVEKGAITH